MRPQEARRLFDIAGPAFSHDLEMLALGFFAPVSIIELHAGEAIGALQQLLDGRQHAWSPRAAIENGMKLGVEDTPAARILGPELITVSAQDRIQFLIVGLRQPGCRFLEKDRFEKRPELEKLLDLVG